MCKITFIHRNHCNPCRNLLVMQRKFYLCSVNLTYGGGKSLLAIGIGLGTMREVSVVPLCSDSCDRPAVSAGCLTVAWRLYTKGLSAKYVSDVESRAFLISITHCWKSLLLYTYLMKNLKSCRNRMEICEIGFLRCFQGNPRAKRPK